MLRKIVLVSLITLIVVVPLAGTAMPPPPARIGGTIVVDGKPLTQSEGSEYTVLVTHADGKSFMPPAIDEDGLSKKGWYVLDIPIFENTDYPDGAVPGQDARIQLFRDGKSCTIVSPAGGLIKVGSGASTTRIDIIGKFPTR